MLIIKTLGFEWQISYAVGKSLLYFETVLVNDIVYLPSEALKMATRDKEAEITFKESYPKASGNYILCWANIPVQNLWQVITVSFPRHRT